MASARLKRKKYENTILYLCQKLDGTIYGKKKLAKLLYYVDFDRFEYKESMTSITGDIYEAWKMGPVPQNYTSVIDRLEKEGKISHTKQKTAPGMYDTEVYTALEHADDSVFDEDDKFILDRVVNIYGSLDGAQLETLTHAEAPYIATDPNQEIIYELAFYRGTKF